MNKIISTDIKKVIEGMTKTAAIIGSTYGPSGKNIILEEEDSKPHITKDGVTVANSVEFDDPIENLGASLIKDASIKTLKAVGDGTTTTAILASSFVENAFREITDNNLNPFRFRTALEEVTFKVIKELEKIATPVNSSDKEELLKIALNASNGDLVMATKIVDLFEKIGKDGIIIPQDSNVIGIQTKVVEGLAINQGYASPMFCVKGQSTINLKDCKVLISKEAIKDYKEIISYLQEANFQNKPILLITPDPDNSVVELFTTNIFGGAIQGCVIKAPYSHERQQDFFKDLGILTGAIKEDKDFNSKYLFGEVEEISVDRDLTVLRGFNYDSKAYESHLKFLTDLLNSQDNSFMRDKVRERLATFSNGVAYITVGAATETELLELKDKLDDTIHAVKAALESGIVKGGGLALKEAKNKVISNPSTPEEIVVNNVCETPATILSTIDTEFKDPTKVISTALLNALSVAGLVFTSKYIVANGI